MQPLGISTRKFLKSPTSTTASGGGCAATPSDSASKAGGGSTPSASKAGGKGAAAPNLGMVRGAKPPLQESGRGVGVATAAVSIILTLHKRPQFINAAINGILNQTFTDWECILVDDGSEMPELAATCRRYQQQDKRIKYIYQKNGGISAARNRGLAESSAPLVAFNDDDDILHPQFLQKLTAFIRQNPNVAAVACDSFFIDGDGNPVPEKQNKTAQLIKKFSKKAVIQKTNPYPRRIGIFLNAPSVFRRDCILSAGAYNPAYKSYEDLDFTLRMAEKYPLAYCREKLYFRRWHGNHLSGHPDAFLYITCAHIAAYCRQNNIPQPTNGESPFNLLTALNRLPNQCAQIAFNKFYGHAKRQIKRGQHAELQNTLAKFNRLLSFSPKHQKRMRRNVIFYALWNGKRDALPVIAKSQMAV